MKLQSKPFATERFNMKLQSFLIVMLMLIGVPNAKADVFNIADTVQGWVSTGNNHFANNGATLTNNYIAGNTNLDNFRDWFEFAIPTLTGGSLTSATLSLFDAEHSGGAFSFAVYGLSAEPLIFTDVTASNPFGSTSTNAASSGTTVSVTLNASALAAITAHQGGNIFIGGIDSGEGTTEGHDFGFSQTSANLALTTAPSSVPEPTSVMLFGTVAAILAATKGRRRLVR